jgi:hypothetical protein
MNTSLFDLQAAIDRAEKEYERARVRHELAERVAAEFRASMQSVQATLAAATSDCDLLKQRLQLALAPASQELFDVVQDEQARVLASETQLVRARERLRRAEISASNMR